MSEGTPQVIPGRNRKLSPIVEIKHFSEDFGTESVHMWLFPELQEKYDSFDFGTSELSGQKPANGILLENSQAVTQWKEMLRNWDDIPAKEVESRVYKGIPHSLRGRAWQHLAGQTCFPAAYYQKLLESAVENMDKDAQITSQIAMDIERTFVSHKMFESEEIPLARSGKSHEKHWKVVPSGSSTRSRALGGRQSLFNVLKAYSRHNGDIGYCQGMSYVAATLMMQQKELYPHDIWEEEHSDRASEAEERVFWLLSAMLNTCLSNYYLPSMKGLIKDANVLTRVLKRCYPDIADHFAACGVDSLFYYTRWTMGMFTCLPIWATTLQIWDLFFYYSSFTDCSSLLIKVSIAILVFFKDQLLQKELLEQLLPFLLELPPTLTPENLIPLVESMGHLDKWIELERKTEDSHLIQKSSPSKRLLSDPPISQRLKRPKAQLVPATPTSSLLTKLFGTFATPSKSPGTPLAPHKKTVRPPTRGRSPQRSKKRNPLSPVDPTTVKTPGQKTVSLDQENKENASPLTNLVSLPKSPELLEEIMRMKPTSFKEFSTPSPPPKRARTPVSQKVKNPSVEMTEFRSSPICVKKLNLEEQ